MSKRRVTIELVYDGNVELPDSLLKEIRERVANEFEELTNDLRPMCYLEYSLVAVDTVEGRFR